MASTVTRNPTSDEAVSGTWSGSASSRYTLVDDYPDTTPTDWLRHGNTAGNLTFGFSAFSIPDSEVGGYSTSITVYVDYYDDDVTSGTNNIAGRLKVGGSYYNATTHNPSTTLTQRTDTWSTNPKTGAAWTAGEVNGTDGTNDLQAFGFYSTDANPNIDLTCIQLRVEYTLNMSASAGSFSLTGVAALFKLTRIAEAGSLTLTGVAAGLNRGYWLGFSTVSFTDSFNTDGKLVNTTGWSQGALSGTGDIDVTSGEAFAPIASGWQTAVIQSSNALSQYAEVTYGQVWYGSYLGPAVCCTAGEGENGDGIVLYRKDGSTVILAKIVNGVETEITLATGSYPEIGYGVTVRLERDGSTLRLYEGGSEAGTAAMPGDTLGDRPGIFAGYDEEQSPTNATRIESFSGGGEEGPPALILTGGAVTWKFGMLASAGSLTLTGVEATLTYNGAQQYNLTAEAGSLTLTGVAALFKLTRVAETGSFTLTGVAALLKLTRVAEAGSLTLTGVDVTLLVGKAFLAETGSFTLTGVAALLKLTRVAEAGSLTLTGVATLFKLTRVAEAGSLTLTGADVTLSAGKRLLAEASSLSLTGVAVLFKLTRIAEAGSLALTGVDVTLSVGERLLAEAGSLTLIGVAALFKLTRVAEAGSLTLTGVDVGLTYQSSQQQYNLTADAGSLALTGVAVLFKLTKVAEAGVFELVGGAALLDYSASLDAGLAAGAAGGSADASDVYYLEGSSDGVADVSGDTVVAYNFVAETGDFSLAGEIVRLNLLRRADAGAFSLVGGEILFIEEGRLNAEVGTFLLTSSGILFRLTRRADPGEFSFGDGGDALLVLGLYAPPSGGSSSVSGSVLYSPAALVGESDGGVTTGAEVFYTAALAGAAAGVSAQPFATLGVGRIIVPQPQTPEEVEIMLQKVRIHNKLLELGKAGIFFAVDYDKKTGAAVVDEAKPITPTKVVVRETISYWQRARYFKRFLADERAGWTWVMRLEFPAAEVVAETFEDQVSARSIIIPPDYPNRLRGVVVRLVSSEYTHPPEASPNRGSVVEFTFEAIIESSRR